MPPPSLLPRLAATAVRSAVPVLAILGLFGLLGSCAGERPSLGAANVGTTAPSGSTSVVSSSTTSRVVPTLGPDDLLGYVATPSGTPVVRTRPDDASDAVKIPSKTGAGAPATFAVIGDPTVEETPWIEVLLPTRPNGATGWVPRSSVSLTRTRLRVFVDLVDRSLRVEDNGDEVLVTKTAIGSAANPTPVGATYVTELIKDVNPKGAYGPFAFGLALHSDTQTEFAGGDGQVGIHGTNRPELIGQAVSRGCVRLTNANIEALVNLRLPLGVPVFIEA